VPLLKTLRERRGTDVHIRSAPQMLQYDAIVDRIVADGPGRTLDWGCGFGQVSHLLRERGVEVVPFDYRPGREATGVEPLERYPGLEHVRDPDGSLEELRRVLRPGGTFYVYNLPNRWSWTERIARLLGFYYHGKLPDDRVYTLRSAVSLFERHGYEVHEARRARMLPLALRGRLATRAARPIWLVSSALERIPGVNQLATTLELVASPRR
jgi:hypothetical protein